MISRYVGYSVIGAFLLMIPPGTAFSQSAGGGSRSASGTAASRGAVPGTTTPGLGTMPLPLPSTSPVGRATTGIIENQQTLDRTPGQPSGIDTNPATPSSDTPAGETATVTQDRGSGGGIATGRMSRVQDKSHENDRSTAVIGPGQLSYPASLERRMPKTP